MEAEEYEVCVFLRVQHSEDSRFCNPHLEVKMRER